MEGSEAWSHVTRRREMSTFSARSLLMTLLGEYVLPGERSPWTSTIVEALNTDGVEEKAARQALARTAADGWITSERDGRRVRWTLTHEGRQLLTEGAERIFSFGRTTPDVGRPLADAAGDGPRERAETSATASARASPGPASAHRIPASGSTRIPRARTRPARCCATWTWIRVRCPSPRPTERSAARPRWSRAPGISAPWKPTTRSSSRPSAARRRTATRPPCGPRPAWSTNGAASPSSTPGYPANCCRRTGRARRRSRSFTPGMRNGTRRRNGNGPPGRRVGGASAQLDAW